MDASPGARSLQPGACRSWFCWWFASTSCANKTSFTKSAAKLWAMTSHWLKVWSRTWPQSTRKAKPGQRWWHRWRRHFPKHPEIPLDSLHSGLRFHLEWRLCSLGPWQRRWTKRLALNDHCYAPERENLKSMEVDESLTTCFKKKNQENAGQVFCPSSIHFRIEQEHVFSGS